MKQEYDPGTVYISSRAVIYHIIDSKKNIRDYGNLPENSILFLLEDPLDRSCFKFLFKEKIILVNRAWHTLYEAFKIF